jgi:hypothetical protein
MTNPEVGPSGEQLIGIPYRQYAENEILKNKTRLGDYLRYDPEGYLLYHGVKITDITQALGTPDEIVIPNIATERALWWTKTSKDIAREHRVQYRGSLDYYYASKAAVASEIVASAISAGWNIETSSEQDLINLKEWYGNRLPENIKIICNGYKWDPEREDEPDAGPIRNSKIIFEGAWRDSRRNQGHSYAEMITEMRQMGADITWIIDSPDEVDYLAQADKVPAMDVGVRFNAYGIYHREDKNFDQNVSRHGMDFTNIKHIANLIEKTKHLNLTTFHAMIGAADSIPMDTHVELLLSAAERFFELKKNIKTLTKFNMGGGIPPRYQAYDHEAFLQKFLKGMQKLSDRYQDKNVEIDFEFGSYVADEACGAAMQVLTQKINNVEPDGSVIPWYIVNYSFMRGIIDQVLINKKYMLIAANNANIPGKIVRVGDPTCDSDGFFRSELLPIPNTVFLPDYDQITEPLILFIPAIQAYEEQLTGIDGVGHCQITEPKDIIITIDNRGKVHAYVLEFKNHKVVSRVLGYSDSDFLNKVIDRILPARMRRNQK